MLELFASNPQTKMFRGQPFESVHMKLDRPDKGQTNNLIVSIREDLDQSADNAVEIYVVDQARSNDTRVLKVPSEVSLTPNAEYIWRFLDSGFIELTDDNGATHLIEAQELEEIAAMVRPVPQPFQEIEAKLSKDEREQLQALLT